MTRKTTITQAPDGGKQGSFDFAVNKNEHFTPRNEPDWTALTRKGASKLVLTLRWLILNNHHFTKAEMDKIFAKPGEGVWSWSATLRKLNTISKKVYGKKDNGKPRLPVYHYNKITHCYGKYIFLMTPGEILKMLWEHQHQRKSKKGGSNA